MVAAELDDSDREARIRLAAPVSQAALERHFVDAIVTSERIAWDEREQAVVAAQERRLGALTLSTRKLDAPDPDKLIAAMLDGVRLMGLASLPWSKDARALQARIEFLRKHDTDSPVPWPNVSDERLIAMLHEWLTPWLNNITRRDHLNRLDMRPFCCRD